MNSFDNIQCEETTDYLWASMMEEMAVYQEWMEEREREAQAELDAIADQIPADHSVEFWAEWA